MKLNREIEELLNSYIDGEVSERQEVELHRLLQHDEEVARRVKELSKYKNLLGSMSRSKAPSRILEQIKTRLVAPQIQQEKPAYRTHAGARHLFARRLVAAAAMITLVALLGFVIYTVVVPEHTEQPPFAADNPTGQTALGTEVAAAPFYGKLILKTSGLTGVDASVNRLIEQSGLSVSKVKKASRMVYVLEGSRQELAMVMDELNEVWDKLNSSTLVTETDNFQQEVAVESITAEQVMRIVNQEKMSLRIMAAKDIDLSNKVASLMPGGEIYGGLEGETLNLMKAPKPVLTGKSDTKKQIREPTGKAQIHLRIIIEQAE